MKIAKRAVKAKKKSKPAATDRLIKVQLDERTTITIRKMDALKFWKERYPTAKVISA
jgi:hypothetical protein